MLHEVCGTFYQTDARGRILEVRGRATEFPFVARLQITDELMIGLTRDTNFAAASLNPLVEQGRKWLHFSKP